MSVRRTSEQVVGRQVTRRAFLGVVVGSLVTLPAVTGGFLLGIRDAHGDEGTALHPTSSAALPTTATPTVENVVAALASGVIALVAIGLRRTHVTARDRDDRDHHGQSEPRAQGSGALGSEDMV